jgi:hypothetical protein
VYQNDNNKVQQLFQVVSSVCFDFVPSRGSPEDNKVWLTLTFSQRVVFVSVRNNNGKVVSGVCFGFEPSRREIGVQNNNKILSLKKLSRLASLSDFCNLVASRILFSHQQSKQQQQIWIWKEDFGEFGFDFHFGSSSQIKTTTKWQQQLIWICKHLSDFCKFVRIVLALTLSPSLHRDFGNSSDFCEFVRIWSRRGFCFAFDF